MIDEAKDNTHDDIEYCEICGKPKEVIEEILGMKFRHHILCDCEVAEEEKKAKEWKEKQRMVFIENLRIDSIRDKARRECRFENAEKTVNIWKCQKYVEHWEEAKKRNAGFLMWGTCGNGKSFAAACIANALIDRGIPAMMTSFPAILDDVHSTMDIAKQMRHFDLVILDDLGAERQSQYALEKVFYVIDERYKSEKPLIVTTNQKLTDMQELAESGDSDYKRIYDRVLSMCTPMYFEEKSRRKNIRQDNRDWFKSLLDEG